jgi:hypothetical protein
MKIKNSLAYALIVMTCSNTLITQSSNENFLVSQGIVFVAEQRSAEAEQCFKQAITDDPSCLPAYLELAKLNRIRETYDQAIFYLEKAQALNPSDSTISFDLAFSCLQMGRCDQAIQTYAELLKKNPNSLQLIYNTGYALKMKGCVDEAIELYKKVIEINPSYDAAQFGLGHAYVHNGQFHEGWKQHQRYLKSAGKNAEELRALLSTNNLAHKNVMLIPEGGFGDTINFIRYAQLLHDKGAYVTAVVQKPLVPLISLCPYIDRVIATGSPAPAKDAWATLMTLPAIFDSDEQTIPQNIPYIFADPEREAYWKQQLAHDKNLKIGICWQSDVYNDSSRPPVARRGMPLEKLFPLGQLPNVSVYSVQKFNADEANNLPDYFKLIQFDESFDSAHGSFMDTVAVMKQMDLILSVDTAVPHLAGALGVPVWLLLPYATDWRWLAHRSDTPWYPTMRIFKQPAPFDWDSVMNDVLMNIILLLQSKSVSL